MEELGFEPGWPSARALSCYFSLPEKQMFEIRRKNDTTWRQMPGNPGDGLGEHVQRKLHSSFLRWHLRDHGHSLAFIFQGWSLTARERAFAKVLTSGQ